MKLRPQRDLSQKQYMDAMRRHGFTPALMGYWNCPAPVDQVSIYPGNAGPNRRVRLAYALQELDRMIAKHGPKDAAT